jgi:hypothetical protein
MPHVIIQANHPGGQGAETTLRERVVAANLESHHFTTQLIERLVWATSDAEEIEARRPLEAEPEPESPPAARPHRGRIVAMAATVLMATVLSLGSSAIARTWRADRPVRGALTESSDSAVVLNWYDIAAQTVAAAAYPEPVTQSRAWSVSWLAAARAVGHRRGPHYALAALAQALHDTLAAQVPAQQAQLDADLAQTLANIPDGPAKRAGIATGQREAQVVLTQRQGDGLDTASVDIPFSPPPPGPGVWQPTPPAFLPAVRAGEGNGKPFLLSAADRFDPGPPPALSSTTYRTDLAEVRDYGSLTSTVRTGAQTDVALFWEPAINVQYVQILRAVLADTHHSVSWDTRFVATFNVITTDAQIAIYNAKFKYVFWRPVTAIRTGSIAQDPTWTPLFTTPRYPDWPSGHGGVAGAAQRVLTAFLGRVAPEPIDVTSPNDPGVTHTYRSWSQITGEVIDARVWEGIHFRFSDVAGAHVGSAVARYDLRHLRSIGL